MHKCLYLDVHIAHNVYAIAASILPMSAEYIATIRLTFCTFLMMSNNAQMPLSLLYNVNAISVSIQPQSSECNVTIRLTFCTTLLMVSYNSQTHVHHEIGIVKC